MKTIRIRLLNCLDFLDHLIAKGRVMINVDLIHGLKVKQNLEKIYG